MALRRTVSWLLKISLIATVVMIHFRNWYGISIILPLVAISLLLLFDNNDNIDISSVKISRTISRDRVAIAIDVIDVKIVVSNPLDISLPILEIYDHLPESCTIFNGSNHWIVSLDPHQTIELEYSVKIYQRGRHLIGPIDLQARDRLKKRFSKRKVEIYNKVSAIPNIITIRDFLVSKKQLRSVTGVIPSPQYRGRTFDFQGVRTYHFGDELRSINWRATARFNQLLTNEFSLDQSAKVFIILDHTTSAGRTIEEAITASLSLAEFLTQRRNMVGFFALGRFVSKINPAVGKKQLLRITELLIDLKVGYPINDDLFKMRLDTICLPFIPNKSPIYLISPLKEQLLVDFLVSIVQRGHPCVVIKPVAEGDVEVLPTDPIGSYYANILMSLNENLVGHQVSCLGVPILTWSSNGANIEEIKRLGARFV